MAQIARLKKSRGKGADDGCEDGFGRPSVRHCGSARKSHERPCVDAPDAAEGNDRPSPVFGPPPRALTARVSNPRGGKPDCLATAPEGNLSSLDIIMSAATSTAAGPVARQLGRGNALRAKTKSASVRAPVRARAARAEILQFAPAVGEDGIRGVFKKQPPRDDLPTVLVAGGGIAGLITALSLQRRGMKVKVFEKVKEYKLFGGPIQLQCNAQGRARLHRARRAGAGVGEIHNHRRPHQRPPRRRPRGLVLQVRHPPAVLQQRPPAHPRHREVRPPRHPPQRRRRGKHHDANRRGEVRKRRGQGGRHPHRRHHARGRRARRRGRHQVQDEGADA